jgi:hypothetical protein
MVINKTNLESIFTFHDDAAKIPRYVRIREAALEFAATVLDNTPPCADQSVAIRKIREAVMTANAAIALDGLV